VATSGAVTGLTFLWTQNDSVVGGNASSYTYTAASSDAAPMYSVVCSVRHALGWAVSKPAYLSVKLQVGPAFMCRFQLLC
jgi:hypothetical protein